MRVANVLDRPKGEERKFSSRREITAGNISGERSSANTLGASGVLRDPNRRESSGRATEDASEDGT